MTGDWRVVANGESIEGIAAGAGHKPETLWAHPENAGLRAAGRATRILKAGDRVFIPALRRREESGSTETRHKFVRMASRSRLHVRFLVGEAPRQLARYELRIDNADPVAGVTDGNGFIDHQLSPSARRAEVHFDGDPAEVTYRLGLAHLDPVTTISGVHQRLRNLGCFWGDEADDWTEDTERAVSSFQRQRGLAVTGQLDEATREALVSAHGS